MKHIVRFAIARCRVFVLARRSESTLSERERVILSLAAEGLTDKEIASRLEIGVATVRTYWDRMRRKLGTINRAQSIAKALAPDDVSVDTRQLLHTAYARMADSNVLPVVVAHVDAEVVQANEAFLSLTGYSRTELESGALQWRRLSPPGYSELDERAAQELRLRGIMHPYVKEIVRKDGTRVPVVIGGARVEGANDVCVAYVLSLQDLDVGGEPESRRRLISNTHVLLR